MPEEKDNTKETERITKMKVDKNRDSLLMSGGAISAPNPTRQRTISRLPDSLATLARAVTPASFWAFVSAPWLQRWLNTRRWPFMEAKKRLSLPALFLARTSAPEIIKNLTTSIWPFWQAKNKYCAYSSSTLFEWSALSFDKLRPFSFLCAWIFLIRHLVLNIYLPLLLLNMIFLSSYW